MSVLETTQLSMSIQNALIFIRQYRESDQQPTQLVSLGDLLKYALSNGFDFSLNDLGKAFQIDWKMRWTKYNANEKITDARPHAIS